MLSAGNVGVKENQKSRFFLSLPDGALVQADTSGMEMERRSLGSSVGEALHRVPVSIQSLRVSSTIDKYNNSSFPETETLYEVDPQACSVEMFGLSQSMLIHGFSPSATESVRRLGEACLVWSDFGPAQRLDLEQKLAAVKTAAEILKKRQCEVALLNQTECESGEDHFAAMAPQEMAVLGGEVALQILKKEIGNDEYVADLLLASVIRFGGGRGETVEKLKTGFLRRSYEGALNSIAAGAELAVAVGEEGQTLFHQNRLENLKRRVQKMGAPESVAGEVLLEDIEMAQSGLRLSSAERFFGMAREEVEGFLPDRAEKVWNDGYREFMEASRSQNPQFAERLSIVLKNMNETRAFILQRRVDLRLGRLHSLLRGSGDYQGRDPRKIDEAVASLAAVLDEAEKGGVPVLLGASEEKLKGALQAHSHGNFSLTEARLVDYFLSQPEKVVQHNSDVPFAGL